MELLSPSLQKDGGKLKTGPSPSIRSVMNAGGKVQRAGLDVVVLDLSVVDGVPINAECSGF